jgi:arylsulfatase A-like enzyme
VKPNFLIFCVDQMQSFCLGCNGHSMVRTPNIDAIAADGITFTRTYCNNPVCMPSRGSLITGLTPRQHGLRSNGCPLPTTVPTITQALANAGYRTHAAGKLHLQPWGGMGRIVGFASNEGEPEWNDRAVEKLPLPYYGFQSVDYVGGHVSYVFGDYARWLDKHQPGVRKLYRPENAYHSSGRAYRMNVPVELHYNNWIADRSIAFLEQLRDGENFFLWCSFPDPHFPFAATRPYSELYPPGDVSLPPNWPEQNDLCPALKARRATAHGLEARDEAEMREMIAQTFGMITHIDDNVGRVMAAVRARNFDTNTIVVFLSDHGEYLGSHHLIAKGAWAWEELVRVPYVWRVPGAKPDRRAPVEPVSLLDFVPTIADYAGVDPAFFDTSGMAGNRFGMPGRSLRPFFENKPAAANREPILEFDENFSADAPPCRMRGIVDGDFKLVIWSGYDEGLLVNVANDPAETRNLWNEPGLQTRKAEMLARLVDRLAQSDRFDTKRISGT